jgi:predicted permease
MSLFRPFMRRLRSLFARQTLERDMAEEMRFHLEERTAENLAAGFSTDEARYAAQRRFGNIVSIQEQARDVRGWPWLELLLTDLRFAFRQLVKSPGFSAIASATLALGIGSSTAIFSVVHALLLSPLQYHDAGQLVRLQSQHKQQGLSGLAPATFEDIAASNASFATLAAQYYYYVNLTGADTPVLLTSADVTPDFFKLFDVAPFRGRTWSADDIKPGAAPVVVLGYALWRSQFDARDSIIGQRIMLDDVAHTVIGVMPASFKDPAETAQLWRPMRAGLDNLLERTSRYWTAFGRLKPGVDIDRANSELGTLGHRLEQAYPRDYEGWTLQAIDLRRIVVGDYDTGLLVVLGAVGCVMLIACANFTGLSIVRAASRRKELAIRAALGSSPGRLIRLLLAESVLLAVIGGSGGVLLANWGIFYLLASLPGGWLPRADEIVINLPVLAAGLALTVLTGVVSGLAPGLIAARSDPNDALKDCARSSAGPSARRLRAALIITEIALAVVLVACTGLLGRSFLSLINRKSGLDARQVLSLTVSLPAKRYDSPARCWDFFSRAQAEVTSVPGVDAAGFTQTAPFRWGIPFAFAPLRVGSFAAEHLPLAFADSVSVDYFRAVGIPLRAGRTFTPADDYRVPAIVVLSETTARRYFGEEDPLGRFITTSADPQARFKVVGIVGDVRRSGLSADIPLQVYRPLAQRTPPFATLMVRTKVPPATLAKSVQTALWRVDPDIPISDIATMDTFVSRSVTQPRVHLVLFSFFATLALLLAGIGLYGLVSYSVEQRTREFGIRTALGAASRDVLALVLLESATLTACGLTLGIAGSFGSARLLQTMIFETSPYDPGIFLAAPLLLTAVAAIACFLPARRAANVDPLIALRSD